MGSSGGAAPDWEIVGLLAELDRLEREAQHAARSVTDARRTLALRAMSHASEEEQQRIFARGGELIVERILYWTAREAESQSQEQRWRWRLFRENSD